MFSTLYLFREFACQERVSGRITIGQDGRRDFKVVGELDLFDRWDLTCHDQGIHCGSDALPRVMASIGRCQGDRFVVAIIEGAIV